MKAKHISKLRKQIHHYRMYRLYSSIGPFDIYKNELNKQPYTIIYGKSIIDAIRRYIHKRPDLHYHLHWLSLNVSSYPDLMILEEGKSYQHRRYFDW